MMVFVNADEIKDEDNFVINYKIVADPANYIQREKKLKLLKDYYITYRDSIIGLARAMIRASTHSNKKGLKFIVKSHMMSVLALLAEMDIFKFLIRHDGSVYAQKILNSLAKINIIEEVKKTVEEEMEFSDTTNNELFKQAQKNKDEILKKLCEIFERHHEKYQPEIIKDLIDAGQLKQDADSKTGKYTAFKSPYEFFCWCFENGYSGEINAAFVAEHIKTKCSLETLKKYERDARDVMETKHESHRIHRKRINPV
jgi:hypothetical protein